jgi:bleomycin hydrolase
MPKYVFMLGAEYTPLEFAHSVCQKDEYQAFTSFTHHPFHEPFVLELADNQMNDAFMNVPIDTLMNRIDSSLRAGHPVCWEGDVSEPGFSFKKGIATIDVSSDVQSLRQEQFEQFKTTDDHCLVLVGIARDEKNEKYYLAKNSWGNHNVYGGFMYLSENYVKLKTIAVMIRRS